MKKISPNLLATILVVIGILCFHPAKSQTEFGVKGGLLFSNINAANNNSNVDFENKNGLTLGVFYKKDLFGPVGLQTEILYQLKGAKSYMAKYEFYDPNEYSYEEYTQLLNAPDSYYRDKEHHHYFTLPVLLTIKTTKFLDLYAGPEFGYLFSLERNWEESGNLNRFSAGIAAGISLKLCEKTRLDFRYSTDLTRYDTLGKNSSVDLKNYGFAFTIQQTIFRK